MVKYVILGRKRLNSEQILNFGAKKLWKYQNVPLIHASIILRKSDVRCNLVFSQFFIHELKDNTEFNISLFCTFRCGYFLIIFFLN